MLLYGSGWRTDPVYCPRRVRVLRHGVHPPTGARLGFPAEAQPRPASRPAENPSLPPYPRRRVAGRVGVRRRRGSGARERAVRRYAARGVRDLDDGASWLSLCRGLPPVPVFDLAVHPRDHELVIATHGRSIFVMDIGKIQAAAEKRR